MTKIADKHYVLFESPGTFVSEQSEREIESWDRREAVALAGQIVERHGARPHCFRFITRRTAEPIDDGDGGQLKVMPKQLKQSGRHFLGGRLRTLDDVERDGLDGEEILRGNMQCNDMPIVCETTNSYRSVLPFDQEDVIVDAAGGITERGDDPKRVAYRAERIARWRARYS